MTVACYVPVPDEALFTAEALAARLAGIGEEEAAGIARRIARGKPLPLGEHGAVYGTEGHSGSDLPGPLAWLADACARHGEELGLGIRHDTGQAPEDFTVAVLLMPARDVPAAAVLSGAHPGNPAAEDRASPDRARELAGRLTRAGYPAVPGGHGGVEIRAEDAARILDALTAGRAQGHEQSEPGGR